MVTDAEVERRLRTALHSSADPGALPDRVLTASLAEGRGSLRRRRRAYGGAVAGVVLAAVVVAGVATRPEAGPDPAPAPRPTPTRPADPVAPGPWVASLPVGPAPEVPYLAGTTVVLPGGPEVALDGATDAGVVGLSAEGLVVLVEEETEDPYSFASRYVLVSDDGQQQVLPSSARVADGAQEALVSPDGTLFTAGADVYDLRDLSVVGRVPTEADVLVAWTPAGIVYGAGPRSLLWPLGGEPVPVPRLLAFSPGSLVGLDGCRVARLEPTGGTTLLVPCVPEARAVSPTGDRVLTTTLRLVDVATGEGRYLAGAPVDLASYGSGSVWWEEGSVLFPVGDRLVRCPTAPGTDATCEQAGGPPPGAPLTLP